MQHKGIVRVAHLFIAGLITIAIYITVMHLVINNLSTWHSIGNESCNDLFTGAFCLLFDLVSALFKIIVISLPVAIILSGLYLKFMKFSLAASILIPFFANIMGLVAIVYLGQQYHSLSLKVLAGIIPIMFIVVGLPSIRQQGPTVQTKHKKIRGPLHR